MAPVRDAVLERFRGREHSFRRIRPVVFLCGGARSARRQRLAQFLEGLKSKPLVFFAEDVWGLLARDASANALRMEAELGELADVVALIVESPGTFAELGAFSLSDSLRTKLLPIVDLQYRDDQSFISTGPLRWIDRDSKFAPTIWTNLDRILEIADEVEARIKKVKRRAKERVASVQSSPKHLLFFVCDLVGVFGPITARDAHSCVERVLPGVSIQSIEQSLALGKAMRLLDHSHGSGDANVFIRKLDHGEMPSFRSKKYFSVPPLRAQILGVRQALLNQGDTELAV